MMAYLVGPLRPTIDRLRKHVTVRGLCAKDQGSADHLASAEAAHAVGSAIRA